MGFPIDFDSHPYNRSALPCCLYVIYITRFPHHYHWITIITITTQVSKTDRHIKHWLIIKHGTMSYSTHNWDSINISNTDPQFTDDLINKTIRPRTSHVTHDSLCLTPHSTSSSPSSSALSSLSAAAAAAAERAVDINQSSSNTRLVYRWHYVWWTICLDVNVQWSNDVEINSAIIYRTV